MWDTSGHVYYVCPAKRLFAQALTTSLVGVERKKRIEHPPVVRTSDARTRMRKPIRRVSDIIKNINELKKLQLYVKRIRSMYPPNVDSINESSGKSIQG